jgi:hypothetical protein
VVSAALRRPPGFASPIRRAPSHPRQRSTEGTLRRSSRHTGESQKERVAAEEGQVSQSLRADEQHRHHREHHLPKEKSPPTASLPSLSRRAPNKPTLCKKPADQLQSRVRREPLVSETEGQVALDPSLKAALSYPHWKWPFVVTFRFSQLETKHARNRPSSLLLSVRLASTLSGWG